MLIDMATLEVNTNTTNYNWMSLWGERTSASDAAITTLKEKGIYIYINGTTII